MERGKDKRSRMYTLALSGVLGLQRVVTLHADSGARFFEFKYQLCHWVAVGHLPDYLYIL